MNTLKIAFGYAFLLVFSASFIVTILGICSVINIDKEVLFTFSGAFLIECIAVVLAAFKSPNFFRDNPESVSKIKRECRKSISDMKLKFEQIQFKLQESDAQTISDLNEEIDKLDRELHDIKHPGTERLGIRRGARISHGEY